MVPMALREKKTYTDKTKLNPAARDDTLRSKDTKRSVCARNWTVFISFLPLIHRNVHWACSQQRVFFFLLYGRSQTYKCITATYLSNGPLTLYLQSQLGVSMVNTNNINNINTVQFLAQTDCFVSLDLNVSSRAAGFNLVLSVYVFFFSQSRGSHWLPLYDWQTATVWVKNLRLCSTEETKSPTSWMPWG